MRRRLNPWVVVLTAALTFGSLMAFVGPRSFGHHYWGRRGHYGPGYYGYGDWHRRGDYEKQRNERRFEQAPTKPDSGAY